MQRPRDDNSGTEARGKKPSLRVSRRAQILLLLFLGGVLQAGAAQETPAEKLGHQIYVHGTGSGKESITALIGDESMTIAASALPCAGCHGDDGAGRPEGGVVPSDIRWQALTKPYGVTHESGRTHPAYTENSLKRAITKGVDPAGNQILASMPRYRMADSDLSALVAYLKKLGEVRDPGVSSNTIRIGAVLPLSGPQAGLGHDIESILHAYFDEVNRGGGIYGRNLELVVADAGQGRHAMRQGCARLVEQEVFAVVAALGGAGEAEASAFLSEREVPQVGPLTSTVPPGGEQNRWVFYVLADSRAQSQALVDYAQQQLRLKGRSGAIVYPERTAPPGSAEAIREQWKRTSDASLSVMSYPSGAMRPVGLVRSLQRRGVRAVFFLGQAHDERTFAEAAAKLGWTPSLLSPGALAGEDVFQMPAAFRGKVFVSFPVSPPTSRQLEDGDLAGVLKNRQVVLRHPALQLWAFRSARTLVEGLKLSGRQVNRERLLSALEELSDFDPGVGPKISFGTNRRTGASGAYIVGIDLARKTFTSGEWLVPTSEIVAGGNGYAK